MEVGGEEILEEIELVCGTVATHHAVHELMTDFQMRAVQLRMEQCQRPLVDKSIQPFVEKCAIVHTLECGQEIKEIQSLFLVRQGEVALKCDKLVYRSLRAGSCFGESSMIKGDKSVQFTVRCPCTFSQLKRAQMPV